MSSGEWSQSPTVQSYTASSGRSSSRHRSILCMCMTRMRNTTCLWTLCSLEPRTMRTGPKNGHCLNRNSSRITKKQSLFRRSESTLKSEEPATSTTMPQMSMNEHPSATSVRPTTTLRQLCAPASHAEIASDLVIGNVGIVFRPRWMK